MPPTPGGQQGQAPTPGTSPLIQEPFVNAYRKKWSTNTCSGAPAERTKECAPSLSGGYERYACSGGRSWVRQCSDSMCTQCQNWADIQNDVPNGICLYQSLTKETTFAQICVGMFYFFVCLFFFCFFVCFASVLPWRLCFRFLFFFFSCSHLSFALFVVVTVYRVPSNLYKSHLSLPSIGSVADSAAGMVLPTIISVLMIVVALLF